MHNPALHPSTNQTPFNRLAQTVLLIAVGLTLPLVSRAAVGDFLVQLEARRVAAGQPIVVQLVVINDTVAELSPTFPDSFNGVLRRDGDNLTVHFQADPAVTSPAAIPPGQFGRRRYVAIAPDRMRGFARLEVYLASPQTFEIELIGSGASEGDAVSAGDDKRFSLGEAMEGKMTETGFFREHFFPYEPFYFIAGPDAPTAKFQLSFKYRLANTEVGDDGEAEGWLHGHARWMDGLHLAYTQRSLWDLSAESEPFLDSSYMPELLYEYRELINPGRGWIDRIGAQIGYQHESNGRDGMDSRSLNIAYLRMPFVFGDENDFHVTIEPRAWFYVGDLSENPELKDYRGYLDLRAKAGWSKGLQVAGLFRAGQDLRYGSTQIDVTYPLHNLLSRSFSIYLQGQYFNGYGESLLLYNEWSETWRIGIGLFR